jgi:formylglycine-generating enzyme required for sulfatase activity
LLALTVHQDYQVWATKFVPLAGQMDVRQVVDGLHMPVAFSEFRRPASKEGMQAQPTTVPLDDITDALEKYATFVILGEPGSGKTTTLQKIAFEKARAWLSGDQTKVPLFVRLSQQKGSDPYDFLQTAWQRRVGGDFADALAQGQVLALVDGINEIARQERDPRLKDWRLFARDCTGLNQIVFTGRSRDYKGQLNVPRVVIEPLDDERIAEYLSRNQADGLMSLLHEPQSHLHEMAQNPFNLALLTFAYKSNQREMANRGFLLAWFVGELFNREERLAHDDWLPRNVQVQALSHLAYAMQADGETNYPFQDAQEVLPKTLTFMGEEIDVPPADLLRFGRAATILDPGTFPDVRFYHHLLQEYFAAEELLRRLDGGDDLANLWEAPYLLEEMPPSETGEWDPLPDPPATNWEVPTILACGLADEPAALVERVRGHNPALAGRCLAEAGIDPPESALADVQEDLANRLADPDVHLRARLQAGFVLGEIGDPRLQKETINGIDVILPDMLPVPAGSYPIGSQEDDPDAYDDEKPNFHIDLPSFSIARWPVTNAEFACFIKAGGYENEDYWQGELAQRWLGGEDVSGGQLSSWKRIWEFTQDNPDWKETLISTGNFSPDHIRTFEYISKLSEEELEAELAQTLASKSRTQPHYWADRDYNNPSQPVVGVTWFEARAYCAWLTDLTGEPYRLPGEVEWEAAARGLEGRKYAWGDQWDPDKANSLENRVLKPSPVGAYAAAGSLGPFGAEDQTGNVWEWTTSLFHPYPYRAETAESLGDPGERVVRGGSWGGDRRFVRCASRGRDSPVNFDISIGFRVVSPGERP